MVANKSFETLRHRREFLNLSRSGFRKHVSPWLLVNYKASSEGGLRIGLTVPKYVGNAVTRNRIKRWLKEIIRSLGKDKPAIPLNVNFVFKRQPKEFYKNLQYSEFGEVVKNALRHLQKQANQKRKIADRPFAKSSAISS